MNLSDSIIFYRFPWVSLQCRAAKADNASLGTRLSKDLPFRFSRVDYSVFRGALCRVHLGVCCVAVVLGGMSLVWGGFGFRGLMAVDSMEFRKFVQSEIKRVMIIYGQGA